VYDDNVIKIEAGQPLQRRPNVHERPLALATGERGDVYLWHPFLVHAADRNRGTNVRFLAQRGLGWEKPIDLEAAPANPPPVEAAIRIGLGTL
jgi:hypothetical protein